MKIHIIILFVTVLAIHHKHLNKNQTKMFYNINLKTHSLLDQIFRSINLDTNFSEKPKIKVLLTMHNDLNNVVKHNYEVFQEIQNVSRVDNFTAYEKVNLKQKHNSDSYEINVLKFNTEELKELEKEENSLRNLDVWEPDYYLMETRRNGEVMKTSFKLFPFIASIHVMERFRCAGAIIRSDLVLTAAACLQASYEDRIFKGNPKSIGVRVGSDFTTSDGGLLEVLEVLFHPDYDPRTLMNNLVILWLKDHINMNMNLKRILLDENENNPPSNDRIIVLSWGSTQNNQVKKELPSLKLAALDVYLLEDCKEIYSNEDISEKNFCAGSIDHGSEACNKDMGGPGIMGNKLVGIISFGTFGCGKPDTPTVFTRITPYRSWIDNILNLVSPYDLPSTTPQHITLCPLRRLHRRKKDRLYQFKTHTDDTNPFQQNDNSSLPHYHSSEQVFSRESDFIEKIYDEQNAIKRIRVTSAEQALTDLLAANSSVITDIINEELLDDFNEYFTSTTKQILLRPYVPLTTRVRKILTVSRTTKPVKLRNEISSDEAIHQKLSGRPQRVINNPQLRKNSDNINPTIQELDDILHQTNVNNYNLPLIDFKSFEKDTHKECG